jgi:hypothetical protein
MLLWGNKIKIKIKKEKEEEEARMPDMFG